MRIVGTQVLRRVRPMAVHFSSHGDNEAEEITEGRAKAQVTAVNFLTEMCPFKFY